MTTWLRVYNLPLTQTRIAVKNIIAQTVKFDNLYWPNIESDMCPGTCCLEFSSFNEAQSGAKIVTFIKAFGISPTAEIVTQIPFESKQNRISKESEPHDTFKKKNPDEPVYPLPVTYLPGYTISFDM